MVENQKSIRPLKVAVIREEFIALTGDLEKSVLLNQLIYWTKRVHDFDQMLIEEERAKEGEERSININPRHGWIYKTASELLKETMLNCSDSKIRRKLRELIDQGWIEERQNPENSWDKRRQFRCNLVKLQTDLFELGYSLQGFPHTLKKPQKTACVSGDGSNSQNDRSNAQNDCSNEHVDRSNNHPARSYRDKEITLETPLEITSSSPSPSFAEFNALEEEDSQSNQFLEKLEDSDALINQAMGIWNLIVEHDKFPVLLNPSLRERLIRVLKNTFQNDVRGWQALCEKIAATKFLMGEGEKGWRVTLEWILDESHIWGVLNGKYFSKSSQKGGWGDLSLKSPQVDWVKFKYDLQDHCRTQCEDERWYGICENLVKSIGIDAFKSWFWKLSSACFEGKALKLITNSMTVRNNISQRFSSDLSVAASYYKLEKIDILVKK